ncbi:mannose-1-phosphate guanylyltransferase [Arachidicoccus ginsenosidimutans]|nr:mannose-1-phosphate guanylyltransferase [Arachidicoccus sp. BS20]
MSKNIYTIIMAGGIGSRFWPQSRQALPKQFVDILGAGNSLLEMTWNRAKKFSSLEDILILTNKAYEELVADHLEGVLTENILTEPSRNNTAPCIAYAAFKLYKKNPDAVMAILPSDQLILKEDVYYNKLSKAIDFAKENNALLTLGIHPTRPDTGYGYIHFAQDDNEVKKVLSFKEKPNLETAKQYIASGDYLWNAGIFIWKAKDAIDAFEKYAPDVYKLFKSGMEFYNTAQEEEFIKENYPKSPNISIDYAIMEKAENVYTVPADMGWSDLGTWASLWSVKDKDENENVVIAQENILLSNTKNSIISAHKEKLVVVDGLEDFIIVDKQDVLLIYPKTKEQEIKDVMKKLEQRNAHKYL